MFALSWTAGAVAVLSGKPSRPLQHPSAAISNYDTLSPRPSLDCLLAGIYAMSFDITGSRLVTCEADKTIKMWKEDETATPESHPIDFRPPKDIKRF